MLNEKTAVLTGCNKGIGKSTLELFSENKCNVVACVRKKSKEFEDFCKNIEKKYMNKIFIYEFDFSNEESVLEESKKIIKNHPTVDILINNAGIIQTSLFQMTKISDYQEVFQINFFNQLKFTQIIIKNMSKNKNGNIVFISSSSAYEANIGRGAYAASKSSIITITKNLSQELARYNIRVNCIAPGLTQTDMMVSSTPKNFLDDTLLRVSMKRVAQPREISNVILFLASDLSSYITGQTIRADGGLNG